MGGMMLDDVPAIFPVEHGANFGAPRTVVVQMRRTVASATFDISAQVFGGIAASNALSDVFPRIN